MSSICKRAVPSGAQIKCAPSAGAKPSCYAVPVAPRKICRPIYSPAAPECKPYLPSTREVVTVSSSQPVSYAPPLGGKHVATDDCCYVIAENVEATVICNCEIPSVTPGADKCLQAFNSNELSHCTVRRKNLGHSYPYARPIKCEEALSYEMLAQDDLAECYTGSAPQIVVKCIQPPGAPPACFPFRTTPYNLVTPPPDQPIVTATVIPKETSSQYSTSTAFSSQNYGDCCSILLKPAQLVVACGCNVIDRDTDPCSYALLYNFLDSCTVTTKGYGVGKASLSKREKISEKAKRQVPQMNPEKIKVPISCQDALIYGVVSANDLGRCRAASAILQGSSKRVANEGYAQNPQIEQGSPPMRADDLTNVPKNYPESFIRPGVPTEHKLPASAKSYSTATINPYVAVPHQSLPYNHRQQKTSNSYGVGKFGSATPWPTTPVEQSAYSINNTPIPPESLFGHVTSPTNRPVANVEKAEVLLQESSSTVHAISSMLLWLVSVAVFQFCAGTA